MKEASKKIYIDKLIVLEQFMRNYENEEYTPIKKKDGVYNESDVQADRLAIHDFLEKHKGISDILKNKGRLFENKEYFDEIGKFCSAMKIKKYSNGQFTAAVNALIAGEIKPEDVYESHGEIEPEDVYEPQGEIKKENSYNPKWQQIIFFGTPGAGKSHKVQKLTNEDKNPGRVHRTTFHPDYDYSTFVGSYKPCPGESDKKEPAITYKFEEQIFMDAYLAAWDAYCKGESDPVWLVIEEINRGNCAQIFGDIFQLLDRDSQGFSKFTIDCCKEILQWLKNNEKYQEMRKKNEKVPDDSKLRLPPTLSIVATMNTSDQSLFPMDSAFKRRWSWEYVPTIPIPEDGQEPDPALEYLITLECSDKEYKYKWIDFIKAVNKKILELTSSEDKQLGAHFITNSVKTDEFSGKVMFYLWNDICKDEFRGNNGNFMKCKGKEFSFNELYEGTKKDRGEILKSFMEGLGLNSIQDETEKTSAEKDTISGSSEGTAEKQ